MDIEEVYEYWFYRISPFRRLYSPIFNLDKYLLPKRIVNKRSIELPYVPGESINTTTIPEYYTFVKKIKNNKLKNIIHNYPLYNTRYIKESNQYTQYIRDVFNRKDILVPGSFLKEFNTISDFYICLNGLCIHPHYLNTYRKNTGFDFSIKYTFSDLDNIIHTVNELCKINNVSVLDLCKFKDYYKPIGVFGYISLSNNRNATDLRLCFKFNNKGDLIVKYQETMKIEEYMFISLNKQPIDVSKIKH